MNKPALNWSDLADKIEQTIKGSQFEPFLSDDEWKAIIAALREAQSYKDAGQRIGTYF